MEIWLVVQEDVFKMKKLIIFSMIFLMVMTIISAYTPTYELCFDENGRGITCLDKVEYSLREYIGAKGGGAGYIWTMEIEDMNVTWHIIWFNDFCFTEGRGHFCYQPY